MIRNYLQLVLIILIISLLACEKETNDKNSASDIDFFKLKDRIGTWINEERQDTLVFVDYKNIIRYYDGKNDFLYRIYDSTLFLQVSISLTETQHKIIETSKNHVTIANMYIGHEWTINYGVYIKMD